MVAAGLDWEYFRIWTVCINSPGRDLEKGGGRVSWGMFFPPYLFLLLVRALIEGVPFFFPLSIFSFHLCTHRDFLSAFIHFRWQLLSPVFEGGGEGEKEKGCAKLDEGLLLLFVIWNFCARRAKRAQH